MCERWINSFPNFYEDMGDRPGDNYTIDRIDNDKGYSPENCRWASTMEQAVNRSDNLIIEYKGVKKAAAEWCRIFGVKQQDFYNRRKNLGWSIENALLGENIKTIKK